MGTAGAQHHRLRTHHQPGLRQAVEIFVLQRLIAKVGQQLGATVGDVDGAAESELGLIE